MKGLPHLSNGPGIHKILTPINCALLCFNLAVVVCLCFGFFGSWNVYEINCPGTPSNRTESLATSDKKVKESIISSRRISFVNSSRHTEENKGTNETHLGSVSSDMMGLYQDENITATLTFWILDYKVDGFCNECHIFNELHPIESSYSNCSSDLCDDMFLVGIVAAFLMAFAVLFSFASMVFVCALPIYIKKVKVVRRILLVGWVLISAFVISAVSIWADDGDDSLSSELGLCGSYGQIRSQETGFNALMLSALFCFASVVLLLFYYDETFMGGSRDMFYESYRILKLSD